MLETEAISDSLEENTPNAEVVLYDVLPQIFSYLNIYDLSKAAKVCKSWHDVARKERSKRGPQIMVLQALEDMVATGFLNINPVNENECIDDFKLSLKNKPAITCFFTDGKHPATADCDNVPFEICVAHQWTQPNNCFYIAVEALGVNINNSIIGGERNITAAVFFPELATVNYTIAETSSNEIEQYFRRNNSLITDITDKLFSVKDNHICFMIFIYQWKDEPTYQNYHSKFVTEFLKCLKSRYNPGTYSLWGAAINDVFTMTTDSSLSPRSTSFCAMGVSGSSVKSWSIVLDNNLSKSEMEDKLWDFKKCVHLKSSSMAFVILPSEEHELNRSKTNIFQNIFPTVNLLSIFNNKNHAVFSLDSRSNESNPKLQHLNSYAYIILTYKL